MKNSTIFIKGKINDLFKKFPTLKIRYEFRSSISTHLIEILPIDAFESNNDYILFEMEIENEFESLFGDKEEILFISSESLNEIRDVHFSLGYSAFSTIKISETEPIIHTFCFEGNFDLITEDNTSYALAA